MKTAIDIVLRGTFSDIDATLLAVGFDFSAADGSGKRTLIFDVDTRIDIHRITNLVVDGGEYTVNDVGEIDKIIRAPTTDGPHARIQFFGIAPNASKLKLTDYWRGQSNKAADKESFDSGLQVKTRDDVDFYQRRPSFLGYVTHT